MTYTLSLLDPTSLPVSQLEEATSLCASDLFAVERKKEITERVPILQEQYKIVGGEILENILLELGTGTIPEYLYNELAEFIGEYSHDNFKIQYDVLSARLLDDISAALGFKSMAWRDAWQHARSTHTHPDDYNHLRCHPAYTSAEVIAMGAEAKPKFTDMSNWLGTVVIYEQVGKQYVPISHDIFMPNLTFEQFPEPDIGEAVFLGWKQFPTASSTPYKSVTINGCEMIEETYDSQKRYWVYPQGQTIQCSSSEFKDACRVFAGNQNATQFRVKDLRQFIKLNPRVDVQDPCRLVYFQNGAYASHNHSIPSTPFTDTRPLKGTMKMKIGKTGSATESNLHGSSSSKKTSQLKITGNLALPDLLTASDQNSSIAEIATETKPYYNDVPFIVYIGKR